MENLEYWNSLKQVPGDAKKTISGGRLAGMTDIKPQWRYHVMTEKFGPIGIGWYYEIIDKWIEEGSENQKCAFVNINLFINHNDQWSKPITGTGGSSFIEKQKRGLHTSDEAFKMALTDALSVSMKMLGVGADVYMGLSGSKYDKPEPEWYEIPESFNKAVQSLKDGIVTISEIESKKGKLPENIREQLEEAAP